MQILQTLYELRVWGNIRNFLNDLLTSTSYPFTKVRSIFNNRYLFLIIDMILPSERRELISSWFFYWKRICIYKILEMKRISWNVLTIILTISELVNNIWNLWALHVWTYSRDILIPFWIKICLISSYN